MKNRNQLLAIAACAILATSCQQQPTGKICNPNGKNNEETAEKRPPTTTLGSQMISVDSANKMVISYLGSISGTGDTELHSIIINADSLRTYLNDTCNGKIANVKLIFAHTLNYINTGHGGQNAGYKSGALTLIIAGYDQFGNYILGPGRTVLDQGLPCPNFCPVSGSATSDIIKSAQR